MEPKNWKTPWLNNYEDGVPPALVYPSVPLPHFLKQAAEFFPQNLAMVFAPKKFSYRQLQEMVNALANALVALGVQKGERVALLLPNSPPYVIGYYAILQVGAIVVNLNPLAVARELLCFLNHAEVRTIIVAESLFSRLDGIAPQSSLENILVTCLQDWGASQKLPGGKKMALPFDPKQGIYSFESLISENAGGEAPRVEKDAEKYNISCLRVCYSGGAPLSVEILEDFEKLTGTRITEGYGLAEASPATHCNPIFGKRKLGSVGLPYPDTLGRIVDLETGEQVLAPGEVGELCIKGPQVMKGYWKMPEETAKTVRDGWLYTGDIARMDEEGYFHILDIKKDMIIAGGFNIYPKDIDQVLAEHPGVAEAVAVGFPDRYQGETVKAFVVLKPGQSATAEEILEFCRKNLAKYKVPTGVEFRQALPKSPSGKILRRMLRQATIEAERNRKKGQ
ncbi:MAG: AMP-binding protein [Proteobacteria bacterium]|nr:AMP-binding protein [Pseudomonadota bacterium]